jgi:hypothetical protein
MSKSLEDSLVEFFKHTTVSAAILRTFYRAGKPLKFDELRDGVGTLLGDQIPSYAQDGAVRSALRLVKSSGWVTKRGSLFRLTKLGEELAERITA